MGYYCRQKKHKSVSSIFFYQLHRNITPSTVSVQGYQSLPSNPQNFPFAYNSPACKMFYTKCVMLKTYGFYGVELVDRELRIFLKVALRKIDLLNDLKVITGLHEEHWGDVASFGKPLQVSLLFATEQTN